MPDHSAGILARFRTQLQESEASDRSFGLLVGAFFFVLGFIRLLKGGQVRWWAVGLAGALLLLAFIAPALLRQPKRAWLFLGFLLGMVVNPIVLGFLFFFVITPAAFIMRLFGRDAMHLRGDPAVSTYWQTRSDPPSNMSEQF
jgi:Saxitoxin biosynthesis operon protein SxtJ